MQGSGGKGRHRAVATASRRPPGVAGEKTHAPAVATEKNRDAASGPRRDHMDDDRGRRGKPYFCMERMEPTRGATMESCQVGPLVCLSESKYRGRGILVLATRTRGLSYIVLVSYLQCTSHSSVILKPSTTILSLGAKCHVHHTRAAAPPCPSMRWKLRLPHLPWR